MNFKKSKLKPETMTTRMSLTKIKEWTEHENPNPSQFDKFIPWVSRQMCIPMLVTVEKIKKEDYTARGIQRASSTRSRSRDSTNASLYFDSTKFEDNINSCSDFINSSGANNVVNLKSYYNQRNQLIEIAIIGCPVGINGKVIQAINLCLPYHQLLKKFVIKGKGLTENLLYEIGKLLSLSNITDVCLDDTYVPEGNYHVLIEKINQLQNISLCRCQINDEVCKTLADNLNFETPASKTLRTIDLSSNRITSLGASYLGFMLRKNRALLYLNLSDNIIGDTGASYILRSLMFFSLTDDERYELKKRKFKYAADKLKEYKKCEKEIRDRIKSDADKENEHPKIEKRRIHKIIKPLAAFNEKSLKIQAEQISRANIGQFCDIFDNDNVIRKNDKLYCLGNLKLCYLNLAYNDINYCTIKKLCEVLKYQSSINRFHCKGLLRVVIDGNNLPVGGELLETIQLYFKNAINRYSVLKELKQSYSNLEKKGHKNIK